MRKTYEKIDQRNLEYGNKGEDYLIAFFNENIADQYEVVKYPRGRCKEDIEIIEKKSRKSLLIEVNRLMTKKWENKYPFDTIRFSERRTIRENCLQVVINNNLDRILIYSHDVIGIYKNRKFKDINGVIYEARKISIKYSKEFSLKTDIDKIKDFIHNGRYNDLNKKGKKKGKIMPKKKVSVDKMADALKWISENLSLTAQYFYYYRQISAVKASKKPKNPVPTPGLLQNVSTVYNSKNPKHDVSNIITDNWSRGASHTTNEIIKTLAGGSEFVRGREKHGMVAKKYSKDRRNTFISIGLASGDVTSWWKNSIGISDPIEYIENKIVQHIEEIKQRGDIPTIKDKVVVDRQLELPIEKESAPVNVSIQDSIVQKVNNKPKTSGFLSKETFQLINDVNLCVKGYSKESIEQAFVTVSSWVQ